MLRLCCCPRPAIAPAPTPALAPDLVADLPPHTRDSSAFTTNSEEKDVEKSTDDKKSVDNVLVGEITHVDIPAPETEEPPLPPRSPSIRVEDYTERSNPSLNSIESAAESNLIRNALDEGEAESQKSLKIVSVVSPAPRSPSEKSSVSGPPKSRSTSPSPSRSGPRTPDPVSDAYERPSVSERDVRNALAECIVPARHEDWEVIVNGLVEAERLAADPTAKAPAVSWRAVVRSASAHVRSLRSRVARTACSALGSLFEHRGRALDTELEEAASSLLERCADVNRFLRADAAAALVRVACGSQSARAAVALARRGATHRAGPVRAAAAHALARLVRHAGASRLLDMPPEPRAVLLRASGELLADANAETRVHARQLCLALAEDARFRPMLKESMPLTRYRAVEKYVDRLRCR